MQEALYLYLHNNVVLSILYLASTGYRMDIKWCFLHKWFSFKLQAKSQTVSLGFFYMIDTNAYILLQLTFRMQSTLSRSFLVLK
jgi:hypothetical protein